MPTEKRWPKLNGRKYIYVIGTEKGPIKIGITNDLDVRLGNYQTNYPYKIKVFFAQTCQTKMAMQLEKGTHLNLSTWRLKGEWFKTDFVTAIVNLEERMFNLEQPRFSCEYVDDFQTNIQFFVPKYHATLRLCWNSTEEGGAGIPYTMGGKEYFMVGKFEFDQCPDDLRAGLRDGYSSDEDAIFHLEKLLNERDRSPASD